jgi:hypothetical protein
VFALHRNWMDDRTRRSRQSPDDAAAPATDHCQAVRPLRPVCFDAQVRVRPHAHRAASDARRACRMGCAAGGCREAAAVLSVRQAALQCLGVARDETRWLSIKTERPPFILNRPSRMSGPRYPKFRSKVSGRISAPVQSMCRCIATAHPAQLYAVYNRDQICTARMHTSTSRAARAKWPSRAPSETARCGDL